jgi:hypothetical protein
VVGTLEPLGVSLDLAADRPPAGRIYLSGYGRSVREYERLVGALDPALGGWLPRYFAIMLGDDARRPTRSAVLSVGGLSSRPDYKLELCAHCAMPSDAEARERSLEWLEQVGVSPEPYLGALDVLAEGPLSGAATAVHVYLGIGTRHGALHSTVYLNPAGGLA